MPAERVMGAPGTGAPLGVTSFWIGHKSPREAGRPSFEIFVILKSLQTRISVIQLVADLFQCRPARVLHRFGAGTLLHIQVLAALRTQALAILAADYFQR